MNCSLENLSFMFLCVEEFNDRILCPDLSDAEMQRLHEEVQKIYETYCLEESIDKISFDPFIIEEIHNSQSHYGFLCCTCCVPRSLILSFSVTSCSRSGAVHRGGEAPDDAMSVWGLWTCAVSAGECLHPHVLPQRWGNFQEMSFQSCLRWCV